MNKDDLINWIGAILIILLPIIVILIMMFWKELGGNTPASDFIYDSIPYQGM